MKLTTILPFAALATAFVIPDDVISQQLIAENEKVSNVDESWFDKLPSKDDILDSTKSMIHDVVETSENAFDAAMSAASDAKTSFQCHTSMMAFDTKEWLNGAIDTVSDLDFDIFDESEEHPHHPKKPHHRRPHRGHRRHHKPNQTVYELINGSKYTTKLAGLINKFPDLVEALNGTKANYTVFAPTDKAFEKIPHHHKDISPEIIKQLLAYHVSEEFYPAGRVLVSHTIPTLRKEVSLGGEAQRLRIGLSLSKALNINFYSRIVAIDIFGTNGVIHGVDSLILPPPPSTKIIELLPGEFSTLQLALEKTGLFEVIQDAPHAGGTLFAPSNWAFKKLGPRINAFLFSKYGEKYLKALLQYHVVANETLYSDAFYNHASGVAATELSDQSIPKGRFHVDLPTALEGKSLSVDVARWGGFITIRINGFNSIAVQDGIARDGVIHVLSSVLIPPKTPGGAFVENEDLSVEEFKERLLPFVEDEEAIEL